MLVNLNINLSVNYSVFVLNRISSILLWFTVIFILWNLLSCFQVLKLDEIHEPIFFAYYFMFYLYSQYTFSLLWLRKDECLLFIKAGLMQEKKSDSSINLFFMYSPCFSFTCSLMHFASCFLILIFLISFCFFPFLLKTVWIQEQLMN